MLVRCARRLMRGDALRQCRVRVASGQGMSMLHLAVISSWMLTGCHDLTGSPGLPAGTPDPSVYNNFTGALGMRNAAMEHFELALPAYIVDAGLLTDELEDVHTGASAGQLLLANGVTDPLDERILPEGAKGYSDDYGNLQGIREFGNQAIGALAEYDTTTTGPDSAKVLRGELYALEGYAEILLADLFCSGVPLSTLDYKKDFTYAASSTWQQVYRSAIFKFDTAITLAGTNDSVVHLAQVGQGRANLDLGNYAEAADDVIAVPPTFRYQVVSNWANSSKGSTVGISVNVFSVATVADREGSNGLPFLSSPDVRDSVEALQLTNNDVTLPLSYPLKYSEAVTDGFAPITVADGVEAQLIQAEAQLQPAASGPWLTTLNRLRESIGLQDTVDPGTPAARIALLFRERAYWLFLTGHRQGDLRRLLRQYGQYFKQQQVYPTGIYFAPGTGIYGTDVNVAIPTTEYNNPYYHGCLDRNP